LDWHDTGETDIQAGVLHWLAGVLVALLGGFDTMNWLSREGLKLLFATFCISFVLGGVVAIVGFTLVVDLMAGK
jgi:hypothetical protein